MTIEERLDAHDRQIERLIILAGTHDEQIGALTKLAATQSETAKALATVADLTRQWQAYINTLPRH